MWMNKLKYLASTASALALLSGSAHAAATITVAVTPMAANAISDIISDFMNDSPPALGYSVSLNVVSDADAKAAIVAGADPIPDLFLAQSFLAPLQLKVTSPSLVIGWPFAYAKDSLVLYSSAGAPVDISAGFPKKPLAFAMPDPAILDPYGLAARAVVRGAYPSLVDKGLVTKTPDATGSYAAVEFLGMAYGFTGKSQICSAVAGFEEYEEGSFHHEYAIDIVLAGIKVARTRTPEEEAELTAFVDYLKGVGSINFTQHCFKLPSAPSTAAITQVRAVAR